VFLWLIPGQCTSIIEQRSRGAEQSRAEGSRAEQSRIEQSRTDYEVIESNRGAYTLAAKTWCGAVESNSSIQAAAIAETEDSSWSR